MLDDLQEIVAHLEKSLRVIEEHGGDEVLRQPELLEKMNAVALSLIQVTRSLQDIERSPAVNGATKFCRSEKPDL